MDLQREFKQCTTCKCIKEFSDFYKSKSGKCEPYCKACRNSWNKKAYEKNKEHWNFRAKRNYTYRKYGLSLDERDYLKALQDNKCKICNTELDLDNKSRSVIDHDHTTGKIRGILCSNCNKGIGLLNDNPQLLQKALEYLNANG